MSARGFDGSVAEGRRWVEADGVHIDVRGLQPPGPLVAILELVESIRDATPVIVVTAYGSEDVMRQLEAIGIHACFHKPFLMDQIKKSVKSALREVAR